MTLVQKIDKEALKPKCPDTQLTGMTMSRRENVGCASLLRANSWHTSAFLLLIYCLILLLFLYVPGALLETKLICCFA